MPKIPTFSEEFFHYVDVGMKEIRKAAEAQDPELCFRVRMENIWWTSRLTGEDPMDPKTRAFTSRFEHARIVQMTIDMSLVTRLAGEYAMSLPMRSISEETPHMLVCLLIGMIEGLNAASDFESVSASLYKVYRALPQIMERAETADGVFQTQLDSMQWDELLGRLVDLLEKAEAKVTEMPRPKKEKPFDSKLLQALSILQAAGGSIEEMDLKENPERLRNREDFKKNNPLTPEESERVESIRKGQKEGQEVLNKGTDEDCHKFLVKHFDTVRADRNFAKNIPSNRRSRLGAEMPIPFLIQFLQTMSELKNRAERYAESTIDTPDGEGPPHLVLGRLNALYSLLLGAKDRNYQEFVFAAIGASDLFGKFKSVCLEREADKTEMEETGVFKRLDEIQEMIDEATLYTAEMSPRDPNETVH